FRVLGADEMIPGEFRNSGFVDYLVPGTNWATVVKALRDDEFALDVTRLTLVCGSAGFDGTQFKNMLAADYDIQLNKTSRNSVLLQTNINNTRSDIAQLIKVLVEISQGIEKKLADGGSEGQQTIEVKRKLDVKEIHGYAAALGLKLLNPAFLRSAKPPSDDVTHAAKAARGKSARAASGD